MIAAHRNHALAVALVLSCSCGSTTRPSARPGTGVSSGRTDAAHDLDGSVTGPDSAALERADVTLSEPVVDGGTNADVRVATGCLRFALTAAPDHRDLPGRIHVRGADGTPDPDFGSRYRASGAHTLVVTATGRGEVSLPTGRYEVVFSHGPEWTLEKRPASIEAGTRCTELSAELSHAVTMADWTSCDLHVHARPSYDSFVTVQDRVVSLVAEGVQFAVPSEHDAIGDYTRGLAALPPTATRAGLPLVWVPAVEVTSPTWGHFNVYPYDPEPGTPGGGVPDPTVTPRELFRWVRAHHPEAILQVNHPRMGTMGYFNRIQLDAQTGRGRFPLAPDFDALEVYNGFHLGAPERVERAFLDWLHLLARGARYVGTASSDSHMIAYHQADYPRTYVYTPRGHGEVASRAVILRSLRAGHAFGTSGPMLFASAGRAMPGDSQRVTGDHVVISVRVTAAPWVPVERVEVYRNDRLLQILAVSPSTRLVRYDGTVRVPVDRRGRTFVVLVARADATMDDVLPTLGARPFAFTNPLWFFRGRRRP